MGYWCSNEIGSGAQLASITYTILCDYANQGFHDAESPVRCPQLRGERRQPRCIGARVAFQLWFPECDGNVGLQWFLCSPPVLFLHLLAFSRSEERRVGKECRSR